MSPRIYLLLKKCKFARVDEDKISLAYCCRAFVMVALSLLFCLLPPNDGLLLPNDGLFPPNDGLLPANEHLVEQYSVQVSASHFESLFGQSPIKKVQ